MYTNGLSVHASISISVDATLEIQPSSNCHCAKLDLEMKSHHGEISIKYGIQDISLASFNTTLPLSSALLVNSNCSIVGQSPLLTTFEIEVLFLWGVATRLSHSFLRFAMAPSQSGLITIVERARYLGNITSSLPSIVMNVKQGLFQGGARGCFRPLLGLICPPLAIGFPYI